MYNILIVEDEVELSHLYVRLFSLCRYRIKVVSAGKDIHAVITDYQPDVILLDIYLRGEDGRDICKEIKQIHQNIPIILVSTANQLKQMADACGADDYIEKPFDIYNIMNKVARWGKGCEKLKLDSAK
ncbi:MAG: DNA-binding response regulator [Ferruginibacter sp.]|uniref:response regulator transcription factor n=1 Tax=Ferruginibacter sp. TaxID=1940288 RepID=UPI002657B68F|nr:response regulator [Ferruginibacter sp.]MDB5279070.1 DNA-binding response regulator [Ferruginibacter sp.]